MRVRDENGSDGPRRRGQDMRAVLRVQRAGVNHHPRIGLAAANQIGVGAWPRHAAAVVGGHADQPGRQAYCAPWGKVVPRYPMPLGIEPGDFGKRGFVRCHWPRALGATRHARHDGSDLAWAASPLQKRLHRGVAIQ